MLPSQSDLGSACVSLVSLWHRDVLWRKELVLDRAGSHHLHLLPGALPFNAENA